MAICLNPQCQKRVASKSPSCAFCGGQEIAEFDTYSKNQALEEELSMENFEKVVKRSEPFIERTIVPKGAKISRKSKIAVRLQYLRRKIFKRR